MCLFNTSKCERGALNNAPAHLTPTQLSGGGGAAVGGPASAAAARAGPPNTIAQVAQCPTFDVGPQRDISVADGSERALSIRVRNMPAFKVSHTSCVCVRVCVNFAAPKEPRVAI